MGICCFEAFDLLLFFNTECVRFIVLICMYGRGPYRVDLFHQVRLGRWVLVGGLDWDDPEASITCLINQKLIAVG